MDNQENNQLNNTQENTPTAVGQSGNQTPETHPMGIPTADSVSSAPAENINPVPPLDPPPTGNLAQAGGVNLEENAPAKKDNKLMFLIIGSVLVLAVILVVMVFSGSLSKSNNPAVPTPQAQIVTPTSSDQDQGIMSQEPITNQQDVTNALGELDKTDPDAAGANLSQNDQDASTFSQ